MSELTPLVSAQLGIFFIAEQDKDGPYLRQISSYGYLKRKQLANRFAFGEGLVGQAALEKKTILVGDVPDDYVRIASSLGEAPPRNIVVLPVMFEGQARGVIELGSFQPFSPIHLTFLEQLMMSVGVVCNMINARRRTEELLEELKGSHAQLGVRTEELEEKASLLEIKNREIAEASASAEEKAKQLALVSKYKSEFLANMSHELRTPLNSLLILANLLSENGAGNLTEQQVEYANTIRDSGRDLLKLISEILDLSKIEAGKMQIERRRVSLGELRSYVERSFATIAQQKGLAFSVTLADEAPPTIATDPQRLEQILKNILSNAFKFTETGRVHLDIALENRPGLRGFHTPALRRAHAAIAFAVSDSGIGIPPEKLQLIFEAFQQADASTSRSYGGTGLGLTISRELARLLGGEIHLDSTKGIGSTFTLYLPIVSEDFETWEPPTTEVERVAEELAALPSVADELASELQGRTLLVVDDDIRNLFAVTSLLERYGARVLPARKGRDAIETLKRNPGIDLVLMDIMMPEMDGYETTREIRRIEKFGTLPIIALTAKAMPGDQEKCVAAGCTDFLPKPVEYERLFAILRQWLPKDSSLP